MEFFAAEWIPAADISFDARPLFNHFIDATFNAAKALFL
jgi:hypothetical protein